MSIYHTHVYDLRNAAVQVAQLPITVGRPAPLALQVLFVFCIFAQWTIFGL
jgi:hypothetical protein